MSAPHPTPRDGGPPSGSPLSAVQRWSLRNSWSTQLRLAERSAAPRPLQPLRWRGGRLEGDVLPPRA